MNDLIASATLSLRDFGAIYLSAIIGFFYLGLNLCCDPARLDPRLKGWQAVLLRAVLTPELKNWAPVLFYVFSGSALVVMLAPVYIASQILHWPNWLAALVGLPVGILGFPVVLIYVASRSFE